MKITFLCYGTALEYFDFILFILLYKYIPFTSDNIYMQFALGYVCRLVGSIILAPIGRFFGIHYLFILSIAIISLATLAIGCLPHTNQSLYILIFLRILQGFAFGVEFPTGGSVAAKESNSGLIVSAATIGAIFASTLYSILINCLTETQIRTFGWRIPFLFGGVVGLILLNRRARDKHNTSAQSQNIIDYNRLILIAILLLILVYSVYAISQTKLFIKTTGTLKLLDLKSVGGLFVLIKSLNISTNLLTFISYILTALLKNIYIDLAIYIIFLINQNFLKNRKCSFFITVFIYAKTLFYALTHSALQMYLVSTYPQIASIHTISLIFSVFIGCILSYKITIDIILLTYSVLGLAIQIISMPGASIYLIYLEQIFSKISPKLLIPMVFCVNQLFITSMMTHSFSLIQIIGERYTYLVPIIYNFINSITSIHFALVVPIFALAQSDWISLANIININLSVLHQFFVPIL